MIARGHRSFGDHVEIVVQGRQMLRKLRGRGTEHPLHGLTLAHDSFFLRAHGMVPCSSHAVVLTARENAAENDTDNTREKANEIHPAEGEPVYPPAADSYHHSSTAGSPSAG